MSGAKQTSALTIAQRLNDQALRAPDAAAILALNRAPLTYKRLYAQVQETVLTLRSFGLGRNDRVAIVLPNGPEMAAAFFGVASGATAAPLNPACRAKEFEFYLADMQAKALIVQAGMDSPASTVARARGIPMVELSPSLNQEAGLFTLDGTPHVGLADPEFAQPDDVALLLHTSGTTAQPKMVPLTHSNLLASADNIAATLELTGQDRCLNVMPLFHIHGLVGALLSSALAGSSVVCTPGFDSEQFFSWLKEFRPTWYTAVPTIHQAVLSWVRSNHDRSPGHSLRFIRSSSAPLAPRAMLELEQALAVPLVEAYGMTEAAHQICSNPLPPGRPKAGSVGSAPATEVSVMNGQGDLLGPGEVGEIVIRGANVMTGYAGSCTSNAESFTNGWFRTGDQGYLDDQGYLFIVGRLKEIINRGGEKISPFEVDQALLDHPAIAGALTFAVPHPTLGDDIAAAVVLEAQSSVTEAELQEFVADRLAPFKVPCRIIIVDTIPRGATGKIQRLALAEAFAEQLKAGAGAPTTALETTVAGIYSEVLGIEEVGSHDNFFLLGGDSLRGTQVISRVRAAFAVNLPIATVFRKPTVAELSREIAQAMDRTA